MQKPYESLNFFYLGQDGEKNPYLYKNKDLVTHGLIIGMTGSGKTGLGVGLIEEASIDNIPSIVIDPKGDMGNLLLAFPNLSADEFYPWIDDSDAQNINKDAREIAQETAKFWEQGLKSWDEDKERVSRYKNSADFTIYTPGATHGVNVNVLGSFNAPPKSIIEDSDFFTQIVSSTVAGILSFVGINNDSISSKEHILLSSIFTLQYKNGKDLSIEDLIHLIINPPFDKVGVFALENFFPNNQRVEFAMKINSLIANPSFEAWREGISLDISKLLYTKSGKARVAIFSISHLSDSERMFFVTLLLNSIIGWMRGLDGTSSLRAILYMDEIFGFFPPSLNPPSKLPMLTLLKQARAFGLGVVLSTQNPVDLDYKGLSNIGTWFIGRLQTNQDKERVINGLVGVGGDEFSKPELMNLVSNLQKRHFLVKNIHEKNLKTIQTRWTLSYLKGPLSREQIRTLMNNKKEIKEEKTDLHVENNMQKLSSKPVVTAKIEQMYFYQTTNETPKLTPRLTFFSKVRFFSMKKNIDKEENICITMALDKNRTKSWMIDNIDIKNLSNNEREKAVYDEIDNTINVPSEFKKIQNDAVEFIYRNVKLEAFSVPSLKLESLQDENIESFRMRLQTKLNEIIDYESQKLQEKFEKSTKALEQKLRTAQNKLVKEEADLKNKTIDTAISFGTTLLGALFGKSIKSSTTASKTASGVKNANQALKEKQDVMKAKEDIERIHLDINNLQNEFSKAAKELGYKYSIENFEVKVDNILLRKTDIYDNKMILAWCEI